MATKQKKISEFVTMTDFTKYMERFQQAPIDMSKIIETNRKNMEAIAEIHKNTLSDMQSIINQNNALLSNLTEENSKLATEMLSETSAQMKMEKNSQMLKKIYQKNIETIQELSDMINQSSSKNSSIINKRIQEMVNELTSSLDSSTTKQTQKNKAA